MISATKQKIASSLQQHQCLSNRQVFVIVENEETSQCVIKSFWKDDPTYFTDVTERALPSQKMEVLNLTPILKQVQSKKLKEKTEFTIHDPTSDEYISLPEICLDSHQNKEYLLPRSKISLDTIMIKYVHVLASEAVRDAPRRTRNVKRTIGDIIASVALWRAYNTSSSGKYTDLQEAAKKVGVPKKSLDDYYYQLRVGEGHGFDFFKHFGSKIAVLRNFIKKKNGRGKRGEKNKRIIKQLNLLTDQRICLLIEEKIKENNPIADLPQEICRMCTLPFQGQGEDKNISKHESFSLQQQASFDNIFREPDLNNFWGNPFQPIGNEFLQNYEQNFFVDFGLEKDNNFILEQDQKNNFPSKINDSY